MKHILPLIVWFLAWAAAATAEIKVNYSENMLSGNKAAIEKVLSSFNDIIVKELGVKLEADVSLFVCSNEDQYEKLLIDELKFSPDLAAKSKKITGGMSSGTKIFVKLSGGGVDSTGYSAYMTTAHELFHQVQGQLAKNGKGQAYHWISEGTADWFGAYVAERVGFQTFAKWQLDRLNSLRAGQNPAKPSEMLTMNLTGWEALMEAGRHPYEVSDFMVIYALSEAKMPIQAIAQYYNNLGSGMLADVAFEKAFSVKLIDFAKGFSPWFERASKAVGTVEIIPDNSLVMRASELAQAYVARNWDSGLRSSMRILVTKNFDEFVKVWAKEIGSPEDKVRRDTLIESAWTVSGSAARLNLAKIFKDEELVFKVAEFLLTRLGYDLAGTVQNGKQFGFVQGFINLGLESIVSEFRGNSAPDLKNVWFSTVRGMKNRNLFPVILKREGYIDMLGKLGNKEVVAYTALFSWWLNETYGKKAFGKLLSLADKKQTIEDLIKNCYGHSLEDLVANFESYLYR